MRQVPLDRQRVPADEEMFVALEAGHHVAGADAGYLEVVATCTIVVSQKERGLGDAAK
jgi:hypothetical protein